MDIVQLLVLVAGMQIAAAASPGPNFVLVSSYATTQSLRDAFLATVGIVVGILIWSSLAVLGLGALLSTSPAAYGLVQYLGAAYLVWLGVSMIVSRFGNTGDDFDRKPLVTSSPITKGLLVSIGNPKTIVYYTSLFAVLVPSNATAWLLVAVVVVDAIACCAWWAFVAVLFATSPMKRFFRKSQKHVDAIFGTALVVLGLKLAFDRT